MSEAITRTRQKWMSTADIAELMQCSAKHVRERIVTRPDFPAPVSAVSPKMRRWSEADVLRFFRASRRSAPASHGSTY